MIMKYLHQLLLDQLKLTHDVEDIYINVYEDLNIIKKITYANGANYLISKKE